MNALRSILCVATSERLARLKTAHAKQVAPALRVRKGPSNVATGQHNRVRPVRYYRRGKPIGRESGLHVYGASRPEGIRTVIPLSFSGTHSAASLLANAPSRILRCLMLLITNTLRPHATERSLSSDQVIGIHTTQRQVYGTSTVQIANHDVPLLCEVRAARLPFVI